MRRAVAAIVLTSYFAAGCGKTLIVAGGVIGFAGATEMAIPDQPSSESSGCNDGPGCVNYNGNLDGSPLLVTGLLMIAAGAVIEYAIHKQKAANEAPPRADDGCSMCPMGGMTGVWRDVPPPPDDAEH